jgi:hypothetical protein
VIVGLLAEPGGAGAEPGGPLVGAGYVAAAGDAAVEAGGVFRVVAVAEGPKTRLRSEPAGEGAD